MENVIKFEVTDEISREQNSILESHSVNTEMEITKTELDLFTVDVETNNQQSVEISPNLEDDKDRARFLFAPFDHSMRPDPELVRLESEKSALDQEAATKLINDRYKFIMEVSARRKEKEQRDKMKFTQISHNMANENILKATQLSHYVDSEDIKKTTLLLHNMHMDNENILGTTQLSPYVDSEDIKETTQLLHNMHVAHENVLKASQPSHYVDNEDLKKTTQLPHNMHPTTSYLTKDQSEEFFESHLEKIFWHNGLNRFIKLNYSEINTTANISGIDMLNAVTEHHQCRVGEAINQMRNEQRDGAKRIAFFQSSRKLGSAKCKKTTQIFQDEFIGASFEDLEALKQDEKK